MSYLMPSYRVRVSKELSIEDGYLPTVAFSVLPYTFRGPTVDGMCDIQGPYPSALVNAARMAGLNVSLVNEGPIPFGSLINGTFTPGSAFDLLNRGIAFVFTGPTVSEPGRLTVGQTVALVLTKFSLVTWTPSKIVDPFAFVMAFPWIIWLSVCLTLVFLAVLSTVILMLRDSKQKIFPSLIFFLWEFFRRLFAHDSSNRVNDHWIRLIVAFFLLGFSVMFMGILNSELFSTMLIMRTKPTVDSYRDVLKFKDVVIYTHVNTSLHLMFQDDRSPLLVQLRPRVVPTDGILRIRPETEGLLDEVVRERAVIVVSPDIGNNLIRKVLREKEICPNLKISQEGYGQMVGNVVLSGKLPTRLRRKLVTGLRIALESGVFQKSIEWTDRELLKCTPSKDMTLKVLGIDQLEGSFIVACCGCAVSIFAFLGELLWNMSFRSSKYI